MRSLLVLIATIVAAAADLSAESLSRDLSALLAATAANFERRWQHVPRPNPLVPITLQDVEQWLQLPEQVVAADDIELFAAPPNSLAGIGGDFHSDPRPTRHRNRLHRVRQAFGKGSSLVINSLHRWCPKAAKLAAALQQKAPWEPQAAVSPVRWQVGLPVDVYMYLTPPFSHSYGRHSDVMDAFMVQLVGAKHWQACDGANCTSVTLQRGDILYLPFGAKHAAHTTQELSAHLTVNIERQFYVWGAVLQAVAARLLLAAGTWLEQQQDMQPFGIEEEEGGWGAQLIVSIQQHAAHQLPMLVTMPSALLAHTQRKAPLHGAGLKQEWEQLLVQLHSVKYSSPVTVRVQRYERHFGSVSLMATALQQVDEDDKDSALEWVSELLLRSLPRQHDKHAQSKMQNGVAPQQGAPQQLGMLAAARAAKLMPKQTRSDL